LLVQASNGNTSIKLDGILRIKASGKWLSHANQEEVLVPVEPAEAREAVEHSDRAFTPHDAEQREDCGPR
jgi:rhamnose utilization protein RhaD (predicted bifunctional aldolase and dehydrogenase)